MKRIIPGISLSLLAGAAYSCLMSALHMPNPLCFLCAFMVFLLLFAGSRDGLSCLAGFAGFTAGMMLCTQLRLPVWGGSLGYFDLFALLSLSAVSAAAVALYEEKGCLLAWITILFFLILILAGDAGSRMTGIGLVVLAALIINQLNASSRRKARNRARAAMLPVPRN